MPKPQPYEPYARVSGHSAAQVTPREFSDARLDWERRMHTPASRPIFPPPAVNANDVQPPPTSHSDAGDVFVGTDDIPLSSQWSSERLSSDLSDITGVTDFLSTPTVSTHEQAADTPLASQMAGPSRRTQVLSTEERDHKRAMNRIHVQNKRIRKVEADCDREIARLHQETADEITRLNGEHAARLERSEAQYAQEISAQQRVRDTLAQEMPRLWQTAQNDQHEYSQFWHQRMAQTTELQTLSTEVDDLETQLQPLRARLALVFPVGPSML